MEMPLPGEDVQEAEEEHMKDLCNKYGIAYDDGVKRRRVPPVLSLSTKYDANARQLHVAVCWKAGVFSDVRALVEETVPGQQVAALRPKPPKIRQQSLPWPARPLTELLGVLLEAVFAYARHRSPLAHVPVWVRTP